MSSSEIINFLSFNAECPPATDGMERFACPTPDRQGRYRCIDDHVLCDGFIDCPEGADEDRQACMFYKTVSKLFFLSIILRLDSILRDSSSKGIEFVSWYLYHSTVNTRVRYFYLLINRLELNFNVIHKKVCWNSIVKSSWYVKCVWSKHREFGCHLTMFQSDIWQSISSSTYSSRTNKLTS